MKIKENEKRPKNFRFDRLEATLTSLYSVGDNTPPTRNNPYYRPIFSWDTWAKWGLIDVMLD